MPAIAKRRRPSGGVTRHSRVCSCGNAGKQSAEVRGCFVLCVRLALPWQSPQLVPMMERVTTSIDAGRERWSRQLQDIASEPLERCPRFPEVAERWEAWWRFEADRPLLCASVSGPGFPRGGKCVDKLDEPEAWLETRRRQVEHTHWYDAAIPNTRVDVGPVALAAFLGAPLHVAPAEQTAWQDPIIDTGRVRRVWTSTWTTRGSPKR